MCSINCRDWTAAYLSVYDAIFPDDVVPLERPRVVPQAKDDFIDSFLQLLGSRANLRVHVHTSTRKAEDFGPGATPTRSSSWMIFGSISHCICMSCSPHASSPAWGRCP